LKCFYENGLSKGLLVIGRELKVLKEDEKLKLHDLSNRVGSHPSFKNKSKLQGLAEKKWC
jgi:hypothetical protein